MKSKWGTHIEPYLHEIEAWAMCGAKEKEIADKLGVSYPTLRKYIRQKPELESLLARCKNHVKRVMQKALTNQDKQRSSHLKIILEPEKAYGGESPVKRPDQNGRHRGAFEKNKKIIYATQEVCGICGKPVDFSLKYPHPLSPCIDHIIPVAKGGHPSDITNLQLAHWTCNRQKSDKLVSGKIQQQVEVISNRVLPQSMDWTSYRHNRK